MKVQDAQQTITSWLHVPRILHPLQLRTAFQDVLYFTGRGYVVVWSESDVEQVDTGAMVTRLASYSVYQGDKPPRRLQLNEISPHIKLRQVSYVPSAVRVDETNIYMWPIYPEPRPAEGDVEVLDKLVKTWFKADAR